ncbi:MAG: insulinase family protein [Gammaproteobacteria bacterium]|nr:insulinase family protein [Gammaproteobacteria bacterium]MBU1722431.1 insulinase family protein [Gammaproteobacteria bacterium]MBU2004632.1 insulinase family protein [Gammaproteobacteria bacterium]
MLKKTFTLLVALLVLLFTPLAQAAPKIENWTTANGLRVYYVHAPELPMLDLSLMFDAGSARDGDKPGLAMLTSAMLNKGAAELNEDQLAEQFDAIGAVFGAGSSMDNASVSLRTITLEKEQKAALDLWLKVLSKPTFPPESFARVQKLTLVGLQAEKQDPATLGSKAFYKALYPDHPYGQPENGTEDSIQGLAVADLQAFYQQYYVAKNGLLTLVGAVERKQAEALAEQIAAVLPTGEAAAPIPEVKPLTAAKTVKIPYPSSQAHILVGQIGNKRGDPDYFTLYMGNQMLGGSGFTSRLMKEVRDARGLSYSVYSYFAPYKELGVFEVGLQTKKEQTEEALKVVRDEISKFQQDGSTAEELEASKKDITGGFPLRTASNSQIANYVGVIAFYNLPLDYLETFTDKINVLTREQIADAFTRRIQPDKMVTVIVGEESETKPADDASKPKDDAQEASQPAAQGK